MTNSSTAQDQDRKGSISSLFGLAPFFRPYRAQVIFALIALVVTAASTLAIPAAFKQMIDQGFGANAGAHGIQNVNATFLTLFGLAALLATGTAARYFTVSWLGERITSDIRNAVYRHVLRQSPEFFETTQTGEVLSRMTADTTLVQTVVGTNVSQALRNTLMFLGGLVMLFVTSPRLASIIIGLL
ncbi:MAG TPA: ABC transporter transmembrane domain-containing protein, partial [Ramlibacter sp.]|nr:ABC transporter transmembrane domain-containing protein [Ramlibacter sp.]